MKEAYVSYETSLLLAEKGFDEETLWYYNSNGACEPYSAWVAAKNYDYSPMPTIQMACAWLREKGFHINVSISYDYSVDADENVVDKWTFWLFKILSSFSGNLIYTEEVNEYDSYEEAVEAALKYTLENLI